MTEQVLLPPTMVELLGHTANYTNMNVRTVATLFGSSGWDASDLAGALGVGATAFTLFAPQDSFFDDREMVIERLTSPEWYPHRESVLKSLLLPSSYTRQELRTAAELQGGSQSVETLSGLQQTISIISSSLTIFTSGSFVGPSITGTDG